MGHAARQAPHRFHFLRVPVLGLKMLLLGQVSRDVDNTKEFAVLVFDWSSVDQEIRAGIAIALLGGSRCPGFDGAQEGAIRARAVGVREELITVSADDVFERPLQRGDGGRIRPHDLQSGLVAKSVAPAA